MTPLIPETSSSPVPALQTEEDIAREGAEKVIRFNKFMPENISAWVWTRELKSEYRHLEDVFLSAIHKAKAQEKDWKALYQDARNLWNSAPEDSHEGWIAEMQEAFNKLEEKELSSALTHVLQKAREVVSLWQGRVHQREIDEHAIKISKAVEELSVLVDDYSVADRVLASRDSSSPSNVSGAPPVAEKQLGDLLAIIHGDGGHYQSEHGDGKAITDAIQKISGMRVALDAASSPSQLTQRRWTEETLCQWVGYLSPEDAQTIYDAHNASLKDDKDSARLDWLELQSNGHGWVARRSSYGRGYRLHNTTFHDSKSTAREAIDAARAVAGEHSKPQSQEKNVGEQ